MTSPARPPTEVLVVAYGAPDLLRACLAPLAGTARIVVVDNSSSAEVRAGAEHAGATYLDPGANLGFAAAVNRGLATCTPGADVLLLNPDARLEPASLETLRGELHASGRVACVAPGQRAPGSDVDDRVAWPFPSPARAWLEAVGLARLAPDDGFLVGSVLLLNADALAEVGGFDERFFLYAEECDWQRRAAALGWARRYCPAVHAEHVGAGTSEDPARREALFHAGQQRYVEKWFGPLGWQCYRTAVIAGACVRAATPGRVDRRADRERARRYLRGPLAALAATPAAGDAAASGARRARLRILHVVCTENFAGVERYVVTVARELSARGHDVTVVGGSHVRMPAELAGAPVRWLPGATVSAAVRQLFRLGAFDIVHAHMFDAELAALLASPRTGTRIVATRHFAQRRGSSAPARLVGRLLTRVLSVQLAISDFVAERTEGASVVVRPGVPDVADPPDAAHRERVVLMLQRLDVEKQGDIGIAAFARSGLAPEGWRLFVAGAGADRARLEAIAASAGVAGACELLGASDDPAALLRRAAIFVATRPDEPYGLSVVEAMAAAVPVVAAGGGGHLETVGTVEGACLFPPGDADAAAGLLAGLAADPERRDAYGAALRRAQQARFTVASQVDATLAAYQRLLGGSGGGALRQDPSLS